MPGKPMARLVAIYNVWDGIEILPYSIKNIVDLVDAVYVVWSRKSNYGEEDDQILIFKENFNDSRVHFFNCEPKDGLIPTDNERRKRNFGLELARKAGFTHFLMLDCDELYQKDEFLREKNRILTENLNGLVCRSQVYFKSPTLSAGYDVTLVPFIHKISNCNFTWNPKYPFAFTKEDGKPFTIKKQIRIDPTRQLSYTSGVEWSDITMHHYSWVREDITKKIKNSSARANIERSDVLKEFCLANEGYFCKFYNATLVRAQVDFGIPEISQHVCESLQLIPRDRQDDTSRSG